MEKNIFKVAAKGKFRFLSVRGALTAEQLWDLPLSSPDGFCLDTVAKTINNGIKELETESFVENTNSRQLNLLIDQLDLVKEIIADKQADQKAAKERAEKRARRNKLLEALEKRESADLEGKSREELLKELDELD